MDALGLFGIILYFVFWIGGGILMYKIYHSIVTVWYFSLQAKISEIMSIIVLSYFLAGWLLKLVLQHLWFFFIILAVIIIGAIIAHKNS